MLIPKIKDSILCDDGVCYTTMSVLSGEIPPLEKEENGKALAYFEHLYTNL